MKIELLVTLKGRENYRKGLILDSEKAPIPLELLAEVRGNTGTVRLLEGELPLLRQSVPSVTDKPDIPKPTGPIKNQNSTEITPEKQAIEKPAENIFKCAECNHKPFPTRKGLEIHKARMHKENK